MMDLADSQARFRRILVFSILVLVILFILCILWGRYPKPGLISFQALRNDPLARSLVLNLRLPRAVMAVLLGASLAAGGAVLQSVFGNPLVEPGFLGVSQGAAFGAALAILLSHEAFWALPVSAAFFGLCGLWLSWLLARRIRYGGSILRLVLSGIVVSALFSSGLGVLKYLADPRSELPEMTFWLMGGLVSADWNSVIRTAVVVVPVLLAVISVRWRINLLSLDDRSAFALGTSPGRERTFIVVLVVIAVAAVTAAAGIVSWVGLLVPHIARKISGADSSRSLPLSIIFGSGFVLVCDAASRSLLLGEIPLGLITAFAGALLFAFLMTRRPQ